MTAAHVGNLQEYVRSRSTRLVELTRELVSRPSENRAPDGAEGACQEWIAAYLSAQGWNPELYTPDSVAGLQDHPLYWPGRNYANRPNLAARLAGAGGGRSLVLSGHIDTVPEGSRAWTYPPFGGEVAGNRLYGRGSNDMKGGVATSLFVVEALKELGITLAGDLIFETVVDEEFGGVNGTVAGRLAGWNADAALITEPTALRICPAQRGGRTAHLTFGAPNGGVLDEPQTSVTEQLQHFLNAVPEFQRKRRADAPAHPLYAHLKDPVPAAVTCIHTVPWGTSEPTNVPSECKVAFFMQAMPGESCATIDTAFDALLRTLPERPRLEHPIRWLPGSEISADHELVRTLSSSAETAIAARPQVQGIEGPCDMYVFHEWGIPAVLWGPRGGNTHNPDEYVEVDSLVDAAMVLLEFVCRWCGVVGRS